MEIFVDLTDFEDCDIIQVPSLEKSHAIQHCKKNWYFQSSNNNKEKPCMYLKNMYVSWLTLSV